jgi:hypothetical protein
MSVRFRNDDAVGLSGSASSLVESVISHLCKERKDGALHGFVLETLDVLRRLVVCRGEFFTGPQDPSGAKARVIYQLRAARLKRCPSPNQITR